MAGLLEAAGVDLPASPPDAFTDDEGNVTRRASTPSRRWT